MSASSEGLPGPKSNGSAVSTAYCVGEQAITQGSSGGPTRCAPPSGQVQVAELSLTHHSLPVSPPSNGVPPQKRTALAMLPTAIPPSGVLGRMVGGQLQTGSGPSDMAASPTILVASRVRTEESGQPVDVSGVALDASTFCDEIASSPEQATVLSAMASTTNLIAYD